MRSSSALFSRSLLMNSRSRLTASAPSLARAQLRRQVVQHRLAHDPLRLRSCFPSNLKLIWAVQPGTKIFRFTFLKIRIITYAVSCPPEGRIAIVTTRWARDAMDAAVQRRMVLLRTASRVVLAPRMLAKSSWEASLSGATVTTSPLHRGEHEVSRKAIAQGMSVCSPLTCMLVCRHSCALWHMRPRVQRAPGIPCALSFERGTTKLQNSGANPCRENEDVMFPRHCERSEAIHPLRLPRYGLLRRVAPRNCRTSTAMREAGRCANYPISNAPAARSL